MRLTREQAVQTAAYIVKQTMISASVSINKLNRDDKLEMIEGIINAAVDAIRSSSPSQTDAEVDTSDLAACIMQSSNPFNLDLETYFESIADKVWHDPRADMRSLLHRLSIHDLVAMLMDIYDRLNCDEHGFNPAESVAAGSSGDFVDSCNHTFDQVTEKYGKNKA